MTDIEKIKRGIIKAYDDGNIEAAKELGIALRTLEKQNRPMKKSGLQEFGEQANRSIANVLGAPVDIMSSLTGVENPVGGSESIKKVLQPFGVADTSPETLPGRLGRITGDTAAFAIPASAATRTIAQGKTVVAPLAQKIIETVSRNPKKLLAGEIASIGGASVAGQYAQDIGLGTTGQSLAEIAGGIASPFVVGGGAIGEGTRQVKNIFKNRGSVEQRASEKLREMVPDIDQAIAKLNEETLTNLTPAQRIGSEELLAAERNAGTKNATDRAALEARDQQNLYDLKGMINAQGSPESTRLFLEARKARLEGKLEQNAKRAMEEAEVKILSLAPNMRRSEASRVMATELEKSYSSARAQESNLWSSIPSATIPTSKLKRDFANLLKSVPKAQQDDIPEIAKRMLAKGGKFKNIENIKELQGLRSKLLEEARIARSVGNYNRARLSDQMSDSLLEEMGALSSADTPVGGAIREALDFSKYVNKTYRQGVIGKALGTDRTGSPKIEPELVSQAVIGSGAEKGISGFQKIMKASPTPEMSESIRQTLLDSLEKAAIKTGNLNTKAAASWYRQNRDILDKYPEVARSVKDAIKAQNKVEGALLREKTIGTNLLSSQKSTTAQYLNADVGKEIDRIINSKNPSKSMVELKRLVFPNKEALNGLKAGTMEYLFRKSGSGKLDEFGTEVISGFKLLKNISKPETKSVILELFGEDQFKNIQRVATEMSMIEKSMTVRPANRIIDDVYSSIFRDPAGVAGAQIGSKVARATGSGTVQTPGIFAKRFREIIDKISPDKAEELLIQAFNDKNLMEALLTNVSKPEKAKQASQKLNLWLSSPAGTMFLQEEDE